MATRRQLVLRPPIVGIATGIVAVSSASIFIRYAQHEAPSLVIAAARLRWPRSSSRQ